MRLKEKEYDLWKSKNIIYELDSLLPLKKESSAPMKVKKLDLHGFIYRNTLAWIYVYGYINSSFQRKLLQG